MDKKFIKEWNNVMKKMNQIMKAGKSKYMVLMSTWLFGGRTTGHIQKRHDTSGELPFIMTHSRDN
jgi:hypothetical protein